jgi:hypothetical protein
MNVSTSLKLLSFTVYNTNLIVGCTSIGIGSLVYNLFNGITSPNNLIYINSESIFTVVNDVIYLGMFLLKYIIGFVLKFIIDNDLCGFISCTNGNTPIPDASTTQFPPLIEAIPWTCQMVCPSESIQVICLNPSLFTSNDTSIKFNYYQPNIFLVGM